MKYKVFSLIILGILLTQFGQIGIAQEPESNLKKNITIKTDNEKSLNTKSSLGIRKKEKEEVKVVIELKKPKRSSREVLKEKGAKIESKHGNKVQVKIRSDQINEYQSLKEVKKIRKPIKGRPTEIISEGVEAINATKLHEEGITGNDTKVGVLATTGFDLGNTEISSNIENYKNFTDDGINNNGYNAHGTGVAEIVVDVAPDTELYLANFDGGINYANAVEWLVENDVDVIVMSVAFFPSPNNGHGFISRIANSAVNSGIVWVNSAGNKAYNHWQGEYNDVNSNKWHNFNETHEINYLHNGEEINAGTNIYISLTWDWENWGSSDQDYDLYIVNSTGQEVASSTSWQNGDDYPSEDLFYTIPGDGRYGVAIKKYNATGDEELELFFSDNGDPSLSVTESSITSPASAYNVTSVGAYNHDDISLASYSSWGPTNDGRQGLDVMGPTRVTTTAYDVPFRGTSSSAPHIAGIASLILSHKPNLTPKKVNNYLKESVIDMKEEGTDYATGYGKVDGNKLLNNLEDEETETTIIVDNDGTGNYTNIQTAINNSNPGDTIIVNNGTYYENVVINKTIILKGNNTRNEKPVVNATGTGNPITIRAVNTTIKKFKITESGTNYGDAGIRIESNNNTITKNNITNNNETGIYIEDSINNTIKNNTLKNNNWSISLLHSRNNTINNNNIFSRVFFKNSNSNTVKGNIFKNTGLVLQKSYDLTIENNTVNGNPLKYLEEQENKTLNKDYGKIILNNCKNITIKNQNIHNTTTGIDLHYTNQSKILNNTLTNNTYEGVYLRKSNNNTINNNKITKNKFYGVSFSKSSNNTITNNNLNNNHVGIQLYNSSLNTIYMNNFIGNDNHMRSESSENTWNSPNNITYTYNESEYSNRLGNYYDDYNGTETNNNGIGETVYTIPDDNNDSYPLVDPIGNYTIQDQSETPGDLNGDGDVSATDLSMAINLIINGEFHPAADMNGDDRVTATDLSRLINMILNP